MESQFSRRDVFRGIGVTTILIASASMAGCSSAPSTGGSAAPSTGRSAPPSTLKVGILSSVDCGAAYLAKEKGWFSEKGLNVDFVLFQSGGVAIEALIGGSLDAVFPGVAPVLLSAASGQAPIRIVSPMADAAALFSIIANPAIKSFTDLKGKTIGVTLGGFFEYFLDKAAEKFNIDPKSLNKVNLQPLDAQAAFLSGKVDAVVPLATSRYLIFAQRPDAHDLVTGDKMNQPPNPVDIHFDDVFATTQGVLDRKSAAVKTFMEVYFNKAVPFVTADKTITEAASLLADWQQKVVKAPTTPDAMKKQLQGYSFYTLNSAQKAISSGTFAASLADQAKFLASHSAQKKVADMSVLLASTKIVLDL